ncbi:MAG: Rhs family protein [Candidatus Magnetoglobus multicellularis str. Araruama]|uniref:Rhs family protein n=1 Tax=Candidatus Magnetoglobus multicellularis str. Araruama TaxID=890399 RepID=A0A1V1NW86_9BACT|nr:MAG: Rhs family protein [Candidatus Magnetoglobus multicellularis str. Araruama]
MNDNQTELIHESLNDTQTIVYPTRNVTGPNYEFEVKIIKTFSAEFLTSLDFKIENLSQNSNGGYVPPGEETLNPSTDTSGEFNNEFFTDKNLVGNSNNDPVITPSTIDPVSTVTGNMYHDETDVVLKGRGLNIVFTRTYNSGQTRTYTATSNQPFNKGWTHSYNMRLVANDYGRTYDHSENIDNTVSSITYVDERGGEYNFWVESDGTIKSPTGLFADLICNDSTNIHTIKFSNGVEYIFSGELKIPDDSAHLTQIKDPYGNILSLHYENGRLETINDNISDRVELTFSYKNDRLNAVVDWTERRWEYGYDTENKLITITNPLEESITYTYHPGTDLLKEIIKPENRNGKK